MTEMVIPPFVADVLATLHDHGFQGFLVGGCVRDAVLGLEPADWDVATDAQPAQVLQLFPKSVAVGAAFGTVVVRAAEPVEVTTFRRDLCYTDRRHPSGVVFTDSILEDLSRRDFTINAMAWDPSHKQLIDPYAGVADLKQKLIRTVGDAASRFDEDALRLLRAVRFACRFDFDMESATWEAAVVAAPLVDHLSRERMRDELCSILGTPDPGRGLWMLYELGILMRVIPELRGSERLMQGKRNAPTLLDHLIQTASFCPDDPSVRLAGLLHDVGKLTTREITAEGRTIFHGHELESARLAEITMQRLRFSTHSTARVSSLIQHHMSHGPISLKTIRRWLAEHDEQWVRDLLALRRADHYASGGSTAPWLDEAQADLETILAEEGALHLSDLDLDGEDVMRVLGVPPGPVVGYVLQRLHNLVLEDPALNKRETLESFLPALAAEFTEGDTHPLAPRRV